MSNKISIKNADMRSLSLIAPHMFMMNNVKSMSSKYTQTEEQKELALKKAREKRERKALRKQQQSERSGK